MEEMNEYRAILQRHEPNPYGIDICALRSVEAVLNYAALKNLGPTLSSRLYYIWFATMAFAYNWVRPSDTITGIKDGINWDIHYPIVDGNNVLCWLNHAFMKTLPIVIPGYDASDMNRDELAFFGWTTDQQATIIQEIQMEGNWNEWFSAWQTWYNGRQADGFVEAQAQPTEAELPNGSQTLVVNSDADDPNTFIEPTKWTPLVVSGKKQKYLTYNWRDVMSSCLSESEEDTLITSIMNMLPSEEEREAEVADLVQMYNRLSAEQKMIAEFWAGGPFTVSPPGMMIWFWKQFMMNTRTGLEKGFNVFFFSGLDLAIHIFETGRMVWAVKKEAMQARPIQEIRRLYRGQTLQTWNGGEVLGELWTPYQTANFVTPPFADFPSGHSAFSRSFAIVMSKWFGASIPKTTVQRYNDVKLLSGIFKEDEINVPTSFTLQQGCSEIQSGGTPPSIQNLSWGSWDEMAESAGISRQYGGIHCVSAHTGSVYLANQLDTLIDNNWDIHV